MILTWLIGSEPKQLDCWQSAFSLRIVYPLKREREDGCTDEKSLDPYSVPVFGERNELEAVEPRAPEAKHETGNRIVPKGTVRKHIAHARGCALLCKQ